jgi:hypothetical protein
VNLAINFIVNPDVIFKTDYSGDNIFIIFLNDDHYYYKIDGIAAHIWKLIDSKNDSLINSEDLYQECLKIFLPPENLFKDDFSNYLKKLIEENIIIKQ